MKLLSKPILIAALIVFLILLLWTLWANTALTLTEYTIKSRKIPSSFTNFRIAQVSDLHNAQFGKDNETLLALLAEAQPDMIAITGDLVDSRRTDCSLAIAFVRAAAEIAPVYYVPGNHESRISDYPYFKSQLLTAGVTVLENESIILEKEQDLITVTGLLDPDFEIPMPDLAEASYQVVLSHRPELLDLYTNMDLELVLTGHAHGGQFRLPFLGGLFAPDQGFFPQYDSGVFFQGSTAMVVSRGLGNSIFPLRLNNRPELVMITLESI